MNLLAEPMDRAYFNRGIAHFLLYKTKNRSLDIPEGFVYADGVELFSFAEELRVKFRKDELLEEQIKRLREIGFSFEGSDQNWESLYKMVSDYVREYGRMPQRDYKTKDGIMLGAWLYRQNKVFYSLSAYKKEMLLMLMQEEKTCQQ